MRSLITLKALTYAPTGGIVAAPTTSLPEQLGGVRNWDYRFCWLRDATFTLLRAAASPAITDEARAWRDWLLRAVAGEPGELQIMYGLAGERRLTEMRARLAARLRGLAPVRIGNAAREQFQLDVYGEVMDALHLARAARARRRATRPGRCSARCSSSSRRIWQRARRGHLGGARAARGTSPTRR